MEKGKIRRIQYLKTKEAKEKGSSKRQKEACHRHKGTTRTNRKGEGANIKACHKKWKGEIASEDLKKRDSKNE